MTLRGALARQSDVQLRRRDQKVSAALFHVTLPYRDPSRCHVQNIDVTWPSLRAELATNLSRCPRSPRAGGGLVVACGSLFGPGLIFLDARRSRLIRDGGIPRPPGRRSRLAASLRSLRAALENASRFLSSAPLRVRIPPLAHKKALRVRKGLERYALRGWDGGIRTPNSRHQKPEFYR